MQVVRRPVDAVEEVELVCYLELSSIPVGSVAYVQVISEVVVCLASCCVLDVDGSVGDVVEGVVGNLVVEVVGEVGVDGSTAQVHHCSSDS